jgi:hypothetical protein
MATGGAALAALCGLLGVPDPTRWPASAEQVPSMQSAWVILADRGNLGLIWCVQAQRSVRAVPVVVLDVDAQGLLEMIPSHDQQPVQTLGPDGANPPLCVGVRRGCLHRCQDNFGALGAEYVVEAAAKPRVAVTQQEAHASSLLLQREQTLRAC